MRDMFFPETYKKHKQRRAFTINISTPRIQTSISTHQHHKDTTPLGSAASPVLLSQVKSFETLLTTNIVKEDGKGCLRGPIR